LVKYLSRMSLAAVLFGKDCPVNICELESGLAVCRRGGSWELSIVVDKSDKKKYIKAIISANLHIYYTLRCIGCPRRFKRDCQVAELAETPFPTEDGL